MSKKKININLELDKKVNKKIENIEYDITQYFKDFIKKTVVNLNNLPDTLDAFINNEKFSFNKIDKPSTTSFFYIHKKGSGGYLIKIPKNKDYLERELEFYKKLKKYSHFPKIIEYTTQYMIFEYVGDVINARNIPDNALQQIKEIYSYLEREKIKHGDIKINEILVKNNIIYLVDFGSAHFYNNKEDEMKLGNYQNTDFEIMNEIIKNIQKYKTNYLNKYYKI
jgi:serine/threonine protein kinase